MSDERVEAVLAIVALIVIGTLSFLALRPHLLEGLAAAGALYLLTPYSDDKLHPECNSLKVAFISNLV